MAKKSGGQSKRQHPQKSQRQWGRTYKNKERAWARHLKKHPNDVNGKLNITEARKTIKTQK